MTIKGQYTVFRKNCMGDYSQPLEEHFQILFFNYLYKKIPLCVYGVYAKRRKFRKSLLLIAQHEKNF
jgi:hypothetical protein